MTPEQNDIAWLEAENRKLRKALEQIDKIIGALLRPNHVSSFKDVPYHGSETFRKLQEQNRVMNEQIMKAYKHDPTQTRGYSGDDAKDCWHY